MNLNCMNGVRQTVDWQSRLDIEGERGEARNSVEGGGELAKSVDCEMNHGLNHSR